MINNSNLILVVECIVLSTRAIWLIQIRPVLLTPPIVKFTVVNAIWVMFYGCGSPGHIHRKCPKKKEAFGGSNVPTTTSSAPAVKGTTLGTSNYRNYLYTLSTCSDSEASPDVVTDML